MAALYITEDKKAALRLVEGTQTWSYSCFSAMNNLTLKVQIQVLQGENNTFRGCQIWIFLGRIFQWITHWHTIKFSSWCALMLDCASLPE